MKGTVVPLRPTPQPSGAPLPPWHVSRGLEPVIDGWLESGRIRPCLELDRLLPAHGAQYAQHEPLHPGLERALSQRGITSLYSHQVQAIEAARRGRHVAIATPTASGKSLCFHLPVLDRLAKEPGATALFLYPTKALSRDQEHGLRALATDAELSLGAIVFDGDTPGDARKKAREKARIVLSNPDMLHSGILPNHAKWGSFFQGLRYVVLDEMHTYRGVFGSHMAHVVARLRRIARFHGAAPTFIGATATIGNPLEHASRLLGVPEDSIELVDQSGAPAASRRVFVYNPPIVNEELGVRQSTLKSAVRLASDLVAARVPTILFGPSRNSVEIMLKYLRERVHEDVRQGRFSGLDPSRAIMAYRGGYLPAMRRDIERGLKEGEILCVVSTSALELGIDIGDLDAVVCAGYPGSIAGTWQRFGRAGRRGKQAALLLVCGSGAVDQYLARAPEYLLQSQAERALIDPKNPEIALSHLRCAAFEAPFVPDESQGGHGPLDAEATAGALDYLAENGQLHASGGRYHYVGEAFPASHISLRNVGWDNFVIVEQGAHGEGELGSSHGERAIGELGGAGRSERAIGELDYRAAHTMLHEQAIYQQDAEQYQVERLDFDNKKAFVRKVEPDYFTTALTYRAVTVLETMAERLARNSRSEGCALSEGLGDVKVAEKVTGYKKIKFFTHENAGYGDVHLPPLEMHTTSYWLTLPDAWIAALPWSRPLAVEALRGLGHAFAAVASLYLMCDPRDLGRTLGDGDPAEAGIPLGRDAQSGHTGRLHPTLFVFDQQPGGVGLAAHLYAASAEIWTRTRDLVTRCSCQDGCPACIGPNETGQKRAIAVELAERLVAVLAGAARGD